MVSLDSLLYKWICRANDRRDDVDLPIGLIEDSISWLTRVLGSEYLEHLLITNAEPVHFLDDEANPLRKWLLSAMVDSHIIQVLELAAYFKIFEEDPSLSDKVEKLKRDSFWPIFFEFAMAARIKRASRGSQEVHLNPEVSSSIGDFTIRDAGYEVPCECSRLGHSPAITEPRALEEGLSNRISDGTRHIQIPLCIKIRSTDALDGDTYNRVLRLIRRGLGNARGSKLPSEHTDGSTSISIEELTETSEEIPFRMVDGRVVNILGADWDSATRLSRVPARDPDEIADRFKRGETFYKHEAVRLFTKFGQPRDRSNQYDRLAAKLKKKLKQTKITGGHFGKVALIEVPFDLRSVDPKKLQAAVHEAGVRSHRTLAIVLANREGNPHIRHHYSLSVTANQAPAQIRPDLIELFLRAQQNEVALDPILGSRYRRSWLQAQEQAKRFSRSNPG